MLGMSWRDERDGRRSRDVADRDAILASAELWATAPDGEPGAGPLLLAGWEDVWPACAARSTADGPEACRACASGPVQAVFDTGRPVASACPSGTRLLAFPVPGRPARGAGAVATVALLRLTPPPGDDHRDTLRGTAVLAAARALRSAATLARWQAEQRARGAERRHAALAALERVVATSEEFQRLYASADRDRATTELDASTLDSLARETLREAEEVRTEIAHELHDTAAQSMISAHRFLEAARTSIAGPDPAAADGHLAAADELLMTAIREVRTVLNSLVPPGLEELGIANALRIYIRDQIPPQITTEIAGELPRVEGWLEAGLFAMTVAALANAVERTSPTTIRIGLRADSGASMITVHDDGIGFDPSLAHQRTKTGMALLQMARRAGSLGGRLDVTTRPGEGTTVRIAVPLGSPGGGDDADDSGWDALPWA